MHINSPNADATVKMMAGWFTPLELKDREKDTTKKP